VKICAGGDREDDVKKLCGNGLEMKKDAAALNLLKAPLRPSRKEHC